MESCLFPDASFRREATEADPAVVLVVVLVVDTFTGQIFAKVVRPFCYSC